MQLLRITREGNGRAPRARANWMTCGSVCVAALCAVAALPGCTLARPAASATALRLDNADGELAEVQLVLELRNTGEDEIELVEYEYEIALTDGARYGGRWAALRALPPHQTVIATVPAVVPLSSLRGGASGWSASGSLTYRDPSSFARILYEAGILKHQVSLAGSGTQVLPPVRTVAGG